MREQRSEETPAKTPRSPDSYEGAGVAAYPLFGKFRLLTRLGKGGMGDVFLAAVKGLPGFSKLVVVKRLRDVCADDPEMRESFLAEGRLAARLNHPNVVQTNEVGEENSCLYFSMEYLEGQPLNRIVSANHGVPLDRGIAVRIVSDALAGLHHAQELCDYDGTPLDLVHRDISPHNIFITYDGVTKVLDFGVAKVGWAVQQRTQQGVVKGKVTYMAPEQLSGTVDRRTDIYSMGVVLWELIANRRLMQPQDMAVMLHELVTTRAPRLSTIVPDVGPILDAIVARALDPDPMQRYQTAKDMREALELYLARGGRFVRNEDVAQLVESLFGAQRHEVQLQVREFMALNDEPISHVSAVTETMPIDQDAMPTRRPPQIEIVAEQTEATSRSVYESSDAPRRRKRWSTATLLATLALVIVVAALIAKQFLPRGSDRATAAPTAAPPAEPERTASPAVPPTASTTTEVAPTASEAAPPPRVHRAAPRSWRKKPATTSNPLPEPEPAAPAPSSGKRKFRTEF